MLDQRAGFQNPYDNYFSFVLDFSYAIYMHIFLQFSRRGVYFHFRERVSLLCVWVKFCIFYFTPLVRQLARRRVDVQEGVRASARLV